MRSVFEEEVIHFIIICLGFLDLKPQFDAKNLFSSPNLVSFTPLIMPTNTSNLQTSDSDTASSQDEFKEKLRLKIQKS